MEYEEVSILRVENEIDKMKLNFGYKYGPNVHSLLFAKRYSNWGKIPY